MDVVVPCDCGSRFSFAVEPVNERLPEGAELLCPSCGKDGVPLANRVIGENLRKQARELAAAQPPPVPKKGPLLRRSSKEKPVEAPLPSYPTSDPYTEAQGKHDPDVYTGPNKVKGMAGALIGGIVGAATWAGVTYWTGYEIKLVAIAVGALAGLGSRTLGGGRDYHLGLFAAACAFMAILVGQFSVAQIYMTKFGASDIAEMEYEFRVEDAKEVIQFKTDADFKEYIAASESTFTKTIEPETISAQRVMEFKAKELPELRRLASGETSKSAFVEQEKKRLLASLTVKEVFLASISPYLFFWVFAGVAAAWKLASDWGTSVE